MGQHAKSKKMNCMCICQMNQKLLAVQLQYYYKIDTVVPDIDPKEISKQNNEIISGNCLKNYKIFCFETYTLFYFSVLC